MKTFPAENDSMSVKKTTKPRAAQKRSVSVAVSTTLKRPTYDREAVIPQLCEYLASTGRGVSNWCREAAGRPEITTIMRWQLEDPAIASCIARAREMGQHVSIEECRQMAEEATPEDWQVVKLRIWERQWAASKVASRLYGDRVQQEISGPGGGPVQSKHEIVFVKPEGK